MAKKAAKKTTAKRRPRKKKKEVEEVVEEVEEEEAAPEEEEAEKAPVHSPTEPEKEAAAAPAPDIHPCETLEEALELFEGQDIKATGEREDAFVAIIGPSNKKHIVPKVAEEVEEG